MSATDMKGESLGAQLASRRLEWSNLAFRDHVRPAGAEPTTSDIKLVRALFSSARTRLKSVVQLGVSAPEVQLPEGPAVGLLVQASMPLRLSTALESSAHPFHEEWLAFRQWALSQDLTVELLEQSDPLLKTSRYVVAVRPTL